MKLWTEIFGCERREIVVLEAAHDKIQSPSRQRMVNVLDCTATAFKFQTCAILRLKFRLLMHAIV